MNGLNRCFSKLCLLLAAVLLIQGVPAQAAESSEEMHLAVEAATMPAGVEEWQMLLVNGDNPLPEDFTVELAPLENGMKADKRICADLTAMLKDCRAAGLKPKICSAYRDAATQTRLHKNKIARLRAAGFGREEAEREAVRWVAAPGTSEHQIGLALDLVPESYQILDEKQAETPEQQWLMAHSWEYGFILRYPTDERDTIRTHLWRLSRVSLLRTDVFSVKWVTASVSAMTYARTLPETRIRRFLKTA